MTESVKLTKNCSSETKLASSEGSLSTSYFLLVAAKIQENFC